MTWQAELEADLDWRFEELAALKLQTASVPAGSILQRALLRSLCAILYAHYEGFCKGGIRLYLEEIRKSGVRRSDCVEELVIFSLQKEIRKTKSFATGECWRFFAETLPKVLQQAIEYELDNEGEIALQGESNLYPELLRRNLQDTGLSCAAVEIHEIRLKSLVGRRNGIAHGKKLTIPTLAAYQEYEDAASAVMYELAFAIIDALDENRFLKSFAYLG
jgi:hypothetical protein